MDTAWIALLVGALAGCAATQGRDDGAASLSSDADASRDASAEDAVDAVAADSRDDAGAQARDVVEAVRDVRGRRYCEVLVGALRAGSVHIDVYNTFGLNDCPAEAWGALDATRLAAELNAAVVVLNGPRYWVMDAFVNSALADPTPRMFGALAMRRAGSLELPLAEAMGSARPYVLRTVARTTTWEYAAGRTVYELVEPSGAVFAMQSYSTQRAELTEDMLPALSARLALPVGWSFRARVLAEDMRVTAVDGVATIVQDELGNTYQRTQQ